MADCKVKRIKEQNGTVSWSVKQWRQVKLLSATPEILVAALQISSFNQLILFSPCYLLLCFLLSSLLHPSHYWIQSALQHILASSMLAYFMDVFITGCICISKCLSYYGVVTILFLVYKDYNRVWSIWITTKMSIMNSWCYTTTQRQHHSHSCSIKCEAFELISRIFW